MKIDPQSGDPILFYAGGRTTAPARDLSGHDLARIVYVRALAAVKAARSNAVAPGETREPTKRPGPADYATLAALADELVATGAFTREGPLVSPPAIPEIPTPAPPADSDGGPV